MKLKINDPLFFLDEKYKELKDIVKPDGHYYDSLSRKTYVEILYSLQNIDFDKYITQDMITSFEQIDEDIFICTRNNNKIKIFGTITFNYDEVNYLGCQDKNYLENNSSLDVEEFWLINQNIFTQQIYAENHIKNFLEGRSDE